MILAFEISDMISWSVTVKEMKGKKKQKTPQQSYQVETKNTLLMKEASWFFTVIRVLSSSMI